MKSQYFSVYNNFDLVQKNLQLRIQQQFTPQILSSLMTYEQIIVNLDEQCEKLYQSSGNTLNIQRQQNNQQIISQSHSHHKQNNLSKDQYRRLYYRAQRNITREIYDNCIQHRGDKVTLRQFLLKYIELLQTAKLCLIREQAKQQVLTHRLQQAKKSVRQSTYVYVKLIQATIHSRYSDTPCFQYKIVPSSIPTVTVVNSLNPILNHQYTLQMEQEEFFVVFYQSGVEIYKWKFTLKDFEKQDGEYWRSVKTEAVTFQIQVKMLPKGMSQEVTQLIRQQEKAQHKLQLAKKAFQNLCYYMPFQSHTAINTLQHQQSTSKSIFWQFTTSLFSFLPFLSHHVLVLHYMLIALIFVQCLASMSWAVEFIDLIISFGLIGALYDRTKTNISMFLWAGLFGILLSTLKTLWGVLLMPFGMPKYPLILTITIIFKLLTMFFLWVCTIRNEEIAEQRMIDLYGETVQEQKIQEKQDLPIFKANQNYYKNKKTVGAF